MISNNYLIIIFFLPLSRSLWYYFVFFIESIRCHYIQIVCEFNLFDFYTCFFYQRVRDDWYQLRLVNGHQYLHISIWMCKGKIFFSLQSLSRIRKLICIVCDSGVLSSQHHINKNSKMHFIACLGANKQFDDLMKTTHTHTHMLAWRSILL